MANILVKLNNILLSKIAISGAIEAKGISVNSAPLSSYADLISQINTSIYENDQSTNFYKCASANTLNQTWTGYKAVLSSGTYSFESTATSGLTYGSGFIPSVGEIYADGALVKADLYKGIPTDNMVLYISFSSAKAETGQSLTFNGSGFNYSAINGIPCCNFSGAGYVDVNLSGTDGMPTGNFTVSYWVKFAGSA